MDDVPETAFCQVCINASKGNEQVLRTTFLVQKVRKRFVVHLEVGLIWLLSHCHKGVEVRNQGFCRSVFQVKKFGEVTLRIGLGILTNPRSAIKMVNPEKEKKVPSRVGIYGFISGLCGRQNVGVKLVESFERTGHLSFVWSPGKDDLQSLSR